MNMSVIKIKDDNNNFVDIETIQGSTGPAGATGATGPAGQGIPMGGNENDILIKQSSTDYDTVWASLVDKVYPVGICIETSDSSFDPNTAWGDTWELIDKEFKSEASSSDALFTANSTNCELRSCYYTRSGHSIQIRLNFTNKVALTDTNLELGNFNLNALGITSLPYSFYNVIGATDGGNALLTTYINYSTGILTYAESTNDVSANNSCYLLFDVDVTASRMIDSFCDKFYWKRTA